MVSNLESFGIESLSQMVDILEGNQKLEPIPTQDLSSLSQNSNQTENQLYSNDFAYIKGQTMAKRALEIAASGGHNVLFIGQPGSGKTLLAKSYPTILPKMMPTEILEVTQIYSICNLLEQGEVIFNRPFRSPHHSLSHVAMVGGGSNLRPGEISLAHRGVLFLDEFAEFSRESIEALRQPLEDGEVTISRAAGSIKVPSRFYLLAAANPTPSGFNVDDLEAMVKPQNQAAINRYQAKFSGPIIDRIDLQVEVNRPKKEELEEAVLAESSYKIRQRVQKARDIQTTRFENEKIFTNSEMNLQLIQKYCQLNPQVKSLLSKAVDKYKMSARSYMRIIKLSRTIADLDGKPNIEIKHLAESLQYRSKFGS